jgi:hypothetical protein
MVPSINPGIPKRVCRAKAGIIPAVAVARDAKPFECLNASANLTDVPAIMRVGVPNKFFRKSTPAFFVPHVRIIYIRSCCLTPWFSCKHTTTIAAKPHPKSACLLQRLLDGALDSSETRPSLHRLRAGR